MEEALFLHWGKNPVIYVKCGKAIYDTVTAALLSSTKLIGHLMDWGFEMNPCKSCCRNKMINKEKFIIVFHVDVLKLTSHKNKEQVSGIIAKLES